MAMTMSGEVALPADRMTVWTALNDPEVLKRCIPGTQELVKVSDTEFQAELKIVLARVGQGRPQLIDGAALERDHVAQADDAAVQQIGFLVVFEDAGVVLVLQRVHGSSFARDRNSRRSSTAPRTISGLGLGLCRTILSP